MVYDDAKVSLALSRGFLTMDILSRWGIWTKIYGMRGFSEYVESSFLRDKLEYLGFIVCVLCR